MKKNISKLTKRIVLLILMLFFSFIIYHELWFLEYYHLPPISFVEVKSERAKLINGIESYQNIDECKSFLTSQSLEWEQVNDSRPSPKDRPPFKMSTIIIKNYVHLGFNGELRINFFNNRLKDTAFYPIKVDKYVSAIEKEVLAFDKNQDIKLLPYTHIRLTTDYKGQKYIRWSDIRLDKEVALWIKRYS